MNRTYEDMSKKELVTLVKRLTKQHDEWSAEAKRLREGIRQIIEHNEGVDVDMFGPQVSDKLKEMIE
tara:strand:+ start:532 stop:732 length:201 start_codon:yes stop_codon:yes gene_type:complete